jgi:hypothetical protein
MLAFSSQPALADAPSERGLGFIFNAINAVAIASIDES